MKSRKYTPTGRAENTLCLQLKGHGGCHVTSFLLQSTSCVSFLFAGLAHVIVNLPFCFSKYIWGWLKRRVGLGPGFFSMSPHFSRVFCYDMCRQVVCLF